MQSERPRLKASVKGGASFRVSNHDAAAVSSSISNTRTSTIPPLKCHSSLTKLVERSMRRQVERRETEMAIQRKDHDLKKRENELEGKEQVVKRKEQELGRTEHELEMRDQELERRDQELERKDQESERKDHEFERRDQELKKRDQELKKRDQELEKRDLELERKCQDLERKDLELERKEQELKQRGQEMNTREHEIERKEQELSRRESIGVDAIEEAKEIGELEKKVMSILNKLTGRNLSSLQENFRILEIISEKQLSLCVKLVFEKAVGDPGHAENCAKLCKVVQMKGVQIEDDGENSVSFRKILIGMCQKEFEKDNSPGFCQEKGTLMKRNFALIQFIGELYMEHMLTARIMHECIKKLILAANEDSLLCLCKLFYVVLEKLVSATQDQLAKGPKPGVNNMSVYFQQMRKMSEQAKYSPSLRRMMQDVVRSY